MTGVRPLALVVFGLLAPGLAAQDARSQGDDPRNQADPRTGRDPRDIPDPRDVPDPRTRADPRSAEADPRVEPEGPALLDALYASGQDVKLKQALGENAWTLLDYIQTQCDTWLKLRERDDIDTPATHDQLLAVEAKGRKLARFADEILLDTRFQKHVDTVFGWSAEQQQQYREGQELYRQGVAIASAAGQAQEALEALTPLNQALERARLLGDDRTQSLALVSIGNLQAANRDEQAARDTMREVLRLGREVRDLDSIWNALSVLYESGIRTLEWNLAEESLQEQYLIARDAGDEQTGQRVMLQLVILNDFRDDQR